MPRPRAGGGWVPVQQPVAVRGGARRRRTPRPPSCPTSRSLAGARTRTCRRRSRTAWAWSWARWSRRSSATRRHGEAGAGPYYSSRWAAGRGRAGARTGAAQGLLGFVVRGAGQALRPRSAPGEWRLGGSPLGARRSARGPQASAGDPHPIRRFPCGQPPGRATAGSPVGGPQSGGCRAAPAAPRQQPLSAGRRGGRVAAGETVCRVLGESQRNQPARPRRVTSPVSGGAPEDGLLYGERPALRGCWPAPGGARPCAGRLHGPGPASSGLPGEAPACLPCGPCRRGALPRGSVSVFAAPGGRFVSSGGCDGDWSGRVHRLAPTAPEN